MKKDEKERKLKEFQKKTKENAKVLLEKEGRQKVIAQSEKDADNARRLKAKLYAKQQRETIAQKSQKIKKEVTILDQDKPDTVLGSNILDLAGGHQNANFMSEISKYTTNRDCKEPI